MKKTILILMLMGNLTSGLAQQTMNFQKACHPDDVKHYDTQTLRDRFVMEKVMAADEINLPIRCTTALSSAEQCR